METLGILTRDVTVKIKKIFKHVAELSFLNPCHWTLVFTNSVAEYSSRKHKLDTYIRYEAMYLVTWRTA